MIPILEKNILIENINIYKDIYFQFLTRRLNGNMYFCFVYKGVHGWFYLCATVSILYTHLKKKKYVESNCSHFSISAQDMV